MLVEEADLPSYKQSTIKFGLECFACDGCYVGDFAMSARGLTWLADPMKPVMLCRGPDHRLPITGLRSLILATRFLRPRTFL